MVSWDSWERLVGGGVLMVVVMFLCLVCSTSNCGSADGVATFMSVVFSFLAIEFGFFFRGVLLVLVAICEVDISGMRAREGGGRRFTEEREKTALAIFVLSLLFLQFMLVVLLGCTLGLS
jgi:hypothetical protein